MTVEEAYFELKDSLETTGYQCHKETYDIALMSLEKQIPKKPTKQLIMDSTVWFCDECGSVVWASSYNCKSPKFCPNCGQKIDWSEE